MCCGDARALKENARGRQLGYSCIHRLFDHFVGAGEERWWDSEPERHGGLEIDDQFELCRLFHRQVATISFEF